MLKMAVEMEEEVVEMVEEMEELVVEIALGVMVIGEYMEVEAFCNMAMVDSIGCKAYQWLLPHLWLIRTIP